MGRLQNIQVNDLFNVVRVQDKIVNGKVVFKKQVVIGTAKVTDLSDDSCQCTFLPGNDAGDLLPKEGDLALANGHDSTKPLKDNNHQKQHKNSDDKTDTPRSGSVFD
jgi:hypothetical protein